MKPFFLLLLCCCAYNTAYAKPYQRIIALTPHACEMMYAIGAEAQLVGAVSYCDYPAQAQKLPRVGSYQRVNVEAALRLRPDMVIVMGRQITGIDKLEALGVHIMVSNPANFAMIFDDILQLGDMTNHQPQAKALTHSLRQRLQRIRQAKPSHTRVFYEVWHDPMLTAGGSSFISDLIHEAGGINVFAGVNIDTPHVNIESVIRAKPELIVIPQEMRDVQQRQHFWRQWLGKKDVQFVTINPDLLHRPGPRLLDGLELLHHALQQAKEAKMAKKP